ncbi:methyl-accepting chemotaxis protein [Marinospirillum celere]|uniref:Methyl-accepting chemotaxis protein n=1 Tax=Marinospirillum celere TaxID=1122252 RepID=A0A1I1E3Z0_9GAMM|nr:hypothetical protein [Marinospirillum celere]SFB79573.1 methyl-accepting chemotaxis protein [Marinospirillum celere]
MLKPSLKNTEAFSMHGLHSSGDYLMVWVQWLLFLIALSLASWYGTWTEALIIGLPAALVPSVLTWMLPGNRITRVSQGLAFMVWAALHIHQAHGLIEMHFGIFVLLAFLLYYRDWLPIVAAAALIAIHHLSFNFLQEADAGVYVFEHHTGLGIGCFTQASSSSKPLYSSSWPSKASVTANRLKKLRS